MAIKFRCECGANLSVADELAGRTARCPACSAQVAIPVPAEEAIDETHGLAEVERPSASSSVVPEGTPSIFPGPPPDDHAALRGSPREYLYLLLAFALVPLVVSVVMPESRTVEERLQATLEKAAPETEAKLKALETQEGIGLEELLRALPGGKIDETALLPRETRTHWIIGAVTAAAFWVFTLLMFPGEKKTAKHLLMVGLFTGTVGIVLLMAFQFAAAVTQGVWMHGRSIFVLLFYVVKFIGWSYASADNPESNFFLSFIGFTCGVGLCEELCKALPLLRYYTRGPGMGWRGATLWGLASGIGFGVAEGILYSSRYYNGIAALDTYIVRFVSCVALHALWSASVGIALWKRQDAIQNSDDAGQYALAVLRILAVPMVLHGLYDTLLKKDFEPWALAIGAVTFAWFAYQVESARATDDAGVLGTT